MSVIFSYLSSFVAGYIALLGGLYMLSLVVPKAGFVARILASYIALLIAAIYGTIASIVLRLAGDVQVAQWATARCFKFIMAMTTGVAFDVIDSQDVLTNTRPAVFIANHQTELDVLMLGCMYPKYCSVTAKSSLKKTPFLGWFMRLSGSIFLDRAKSSDARQAMTGAAEEMRSRRQSVFMFPEGTRSYAKDPMLLPFKKGAFHLAVQAQVPIVPCVVANYSHILWAKGMVFKSGRAPVKILDPIPTTGLTIADVDELTRSTRDLMLTELEKLTAQARGSPMAVLAHGDRNGAMKVNGLVR